MTTVVLPEPPSPQGSHPSHPHSSHTHWVLVVTIVIVEVVVVEVGTVVVTVETVDMVVIVEVVVVSTEVVVVVCGGGGGGGGGGDGGWGQGTVGRVEPGPHAGGGGGDGGDGGGGGDGDGGSVEDGGGAGGVVVTFNKLPEAPSVSFVTPLKKEVWAAMVVASTEHRFVEQEQGACGVPIKWVWQTLSQVLLSSVSLKIFSGRRQLLASPFGMCSNTATITMYGSK